MENLLQKDPTSSRLHDQRAGGRGVYEALKAAGKEKGVLVVSVDGGCPGVKNVKAGVIGATSQQYPLLMAARRAGGRRLRQDRQEAAPSLFDTGVNLVTDKPVAGVPSISTDEGLKLCWG